MSKSHPAVLRLTTALACLALAACGERPTVGVPPASDDDLLKASDVIVSAQCELNRQAAAGVDGIAFRRAVLTMTLTVAVTEATGGGLTLSIPVAGSRIALERGRRPVGTALRRMDIQILHDVTRPLACPSNAAPTTVDGVRYIEGGLGLEEWIVESGAIARRSGTLPTELHYDLKFEIGLSDDFNPVFSRSSAAGVSPDLSPENADSRLVAHRVAVTVIPDGQRGRVTDDDRLGAAQRYLARTNQN